MSEFYDHYWSGTASTVAKAVEGFENVLGPVTLDDITITCVRHTEALPLPKGLKDRPALGRAVVGVFADSNPVEAATVEDEPDAV